MENKGKTRVLIDRQEYAFVGHGMNVVVYDKTAGSVIDGVGFDEDKGLQAVRKRKQD